GCGERIQEWETDAARRRERTRLAPGYRDSHGVLGDHRVEARHATDGAHAAASRREERKGVRALPRPRRGTDRKREAPRVGAIPDDDRDIIDGRRERRAREV